MLDFVFEQWNFAILKHWGSKAETTIILSCPFFKLVLQFYTFIVSFVSNILWYIPR